ncbi:DUF4247 domain-containing protein [Paenibacillus agricola]|jgi:hypothetical protein|uniref:DUF4247 domain-containing protein n=1 Tax=Paenibacillus agricola TaxID=2716264 RepID=A0ABX0J8S6_9BACL|nr:DUF4247 domain-containing protein [Paenibacillus agricola]NHN31257.1 DUF4247 domain-containing protein [Paenibacillus agricola]
MNKRHITWIAVVLIFVVIFAMLSGFGDAGNYVKDNYSLVDVQGNGKNTAKVYSVEGKDVPTVANELADQEEPTEKSKESTEQMFLFYSNKIINIQKDPANASNSLVEVDSIEYAKKNYDSSFLEGYIAASVLQQLLGNSWSSSSKSGSDYKGYTTTKRYDDYGKYQKPEPKKEPVNSTPAPTTTNRQGSFGTTPSTTAPSTKAPTTGSSTAPKSTAPTTSDTKGSFGTTPSTSTKPSSSSSSSSSSSNVRKNDGSKANTKTTKPSTSNRSGSFKKK